MRTHVCLYTTLTPDFFISEFIFHFAVIVLYQNLSGEGPISWRVRGTAAIGSGIMRVQIWFETHSDELHSTTPSNNRHSPTWNFSRDGGTIDYYCGESCLGLGVLFFICRGYI